MSDLPAEGPDARLHEFEHRTCGTLLFRWKGPARRGMFAAANRIILPNGQPGQPGDMVWCDTCVRPIHEGEERLRGEWDA